MFDTLTVKQREVMDLVAENHTSKEIAWKLGISESAVNQRIEAIRMRAGNPPRSELARGYRMHLSSLVGNGDVAAEALQPAERSAAERSVREVEPALRRAAYMVAIACGLLLAALLSLGVARLAKILT